MDETMSAVERHALERSGEKLRYADEKIGVLVAGNFPELGRITALRFIEWAQGHPEGVVSLPTGKTPEYFIKELQRYLASWETRQVREELERWGVDCPARPDMRGLRFVQIDEFYPISPAHNNSFYHYVNSFYLDLLGMQRDRALLIHCGDIPVPGDISHEELWGEQGVDLTLRFRAPRGRLERIRQETLYRIDQWCVTYEDRVRALGGIGFFLGGIGPDGHIGFNVRGSDMHSTTRLSEINYETQAAASVDLGGIESVRKRLVITIGLSTITHNRDCVAIVMAAGEAKAAIVGRSVASGRDVLYPATALQSLPGSRFYLTEGAAKKLGARCAARMQSRAILDEEEIEGIILDISLRTKTRITDLREDHFRADTFGRIALEKMGAPPDACCRRVHDRLVRKIEAGMEVARGSRILHTEPHDDDIMLGYFPFAVRHFRERSNDHHFATFTSGFTAVTNHYMLLLCTGMKRALGENLYGLHEKHGGDYFDRKNEEYRNRDVWTYLDGVASHSEEKKNEGRLSRFLRDLMIVFDESGMDNIIARLDELINYFRTQYPGKKDLPYIQQLKGMCREWESSCLWGYFGWMGGAIEHLRLGFYQGDIFTEEPTLERDIVPVVRLLERTRPDIVTVAFDPEASGPDTHYKVLQAVSESLRLHGRRDIDVIGYRNIWYRFSPHETNLFVPVSLNMLTLQYEAFMNAYISQKDASFPSPELDGPFPLLMQKIQVEQYEMLKVFLGEEYFYNHPSALIRATRGFLFLKRMSVDEFIARSGELRRMIEDPADA